MAIIQPFRALRPQAQYAKQVASRPYDVLNSKEAKQEAQGNPFSFLHITKPEIDLPEGTHLYDEAVYEKAKENLQAFMQRDLLFVENKACYYIYRLIMDGHSQTGLVAASSVKDYDNNIIKKHEFTRPEKENDRIRHMKVCEAQTGNVFLAYRDVAELNQLIGKWQEEKSPIYDFTTDDGVQHSVWVVNDDALIAQLTTVFKQQVPCTYIADGHHRAASAAKVKAAWGKEAPLSASVFLTTLFPAGQLRILDYNRVIKDLNGHTPQQLIEKIAADFEIIEESRKPIKPDAPHQFGMYLDGKWYRLRAIAGRYDAVHPIESLDVSILSKLILEQHLGIIDQRTDQRIDFVGGIRGLGELQNRVDSGEMQLAFSLYPVTMEQLFAVADSGEVMPPKSTWFEPKLRDGLLTHLLA
ncbi:MAG: DUF1015 family protein [Bacteroidetes bacterium]|nr:DUF1015 family protein [Bacteroidota bacterium]